MAVLRFHQNSLSKVHSLMELGHLLPQRIHLGQELRILGRLGMAAQAVGKRSAHRTNRKEEQSSPSEYECDG